MARPPVLAVDVGGTSFKAALVGPDGGFHSVESQPTEGSQGEAAYQRLEAFIAGMLARTGETPPAAIGLICPGMEEASGCVLFAANLGWRDFPLGARLGSRFGLAVAGGHDVRTAGLAEWRLGAAKGETDAAMVMIGTGIAGAFIANGAMINGARQMACEIGHVPIYPGGEACACGQFGCLETYASASAIARRYRAAGGVEGLTAAGIAGRLDRDAVAARIWQEAVEALSIALATITFMLDPAVIIIGGGLAEAGEVLLRPLDAALRRRLAWREPPLLRASALGQRGVLLGAAIRAWESLGEETEMGQGFALPGF